MIDRVVHVAEVDGDAIFDIVGTGKGGVPATAHSDPAFRVSEKRRQGDCDFVSIAGLDNAPGCQLCGHRPVRLRALVICGRVRVGYGKASFGKSMALRICEYNFMFIKQEAEFLRK